MSKKSGEIKVLLICQHLKFDITNVVLIFFQIFLLCWYLKLRFVENTSWTKIPKNNHCAVSTVEAARGFPLSITVRWDMERWGCLLRLLLKVYSSLPTTHHNSTKKKFRLPYRYRNWSLGSVPDAKTWFRSYTTKNLGAIFWNYYLLPLTFYHLFEFPAKDSFWNSSGKSASIRLVMKIWGALLFQYASRYVKSTIGELSWHLNSYQYFMTTNDLNFQIVFLHLIVFLMSTIVRYL